MANIEKTKTEKNVVELRKKFDASGTGFDMVYVNGVEFTCIGYSSEEDKKTCLKMIQEVVDSSESLGSAAAKLACLCRLGGKNVCPDEEVVVNRRSYFISYADKTAYDASGEAVAKVKSKDDMPESAIKEILMLQLK